MHNVFDYSYTFVIAYFYNRVGVFNKKLKRYIYSIRLISENKDCYLAVSGVRNSKLKRVLEKADKKYGIKNTIFYIMFLPRGQLVVFLETPTLTKEYVMNKYFLDAPGVMREYVEEHFEDEEIMSKEVLYQLLLKKFTKDEIKAFVPGLYEEVIYK